MPGRAYSLFHEGLDEASDLVLIVIGHVHVQSQRHYICDFALVFWQHVVIACSCVRPPRESLIIFTREGSTKRAE